MEPYWSVIFELTSFLHLLFFAIGIGAAGLLEFILPQQMITKISDNSIALMHRGHRLISFALLGLWISGASLAIMRLKVENAPLSPKLIIKLFIISVLTLNMIAIGKLVVARIEEHIDRSALEIPPYQFGTMGGVMGLSAACWLSALAIGSVAHFNPMDIKTLATIFLPFLLSSILIGIVASRLLLWRGTMIRQS
ncbi:MAG: hypothetical protein AAGG56_07400 [Pseudomonadota bacterium]